MRKIFHWFACASVLSVSCTAPIDSKPEFQGTKVQTPAGIRRLTSPEITPLVVGRRIQNAQKRQKYSGDIIITSAQWLDLRPDGTATFRADLWSKDGRYYVADDRLCVVLPRSDRITSQNRVIHDLGQDVECHSFFVDDEGARYISGPLMGDEGLAAIETKPL